MSDVYSSDQLNSVIDAAKRFNIELDEKEAMAWNEELTEK